jgi:hypothetical protein
MFDVKKLVAAVAVLGFALVLAGGAMAAEEKKSETVKGTVSVVKADDKVTVTLKSGDVVYGVAGDKAKELEGLDKKEVEVTGKVEEKDGKKTITVESVKEVVKDATK